jgi:hypothetical protein
VPRAHRRLLATLLQPVMRIVTYRLEHAEPRHVVVRLGHEEVLVGERRQKVEHLAPVNVLATAHALGGLDSPAACKDGRATQHCLLGIPQQVVAPVDQRAQCAMTWKCGPGPPGQDAEPVVEVPAQFLQRHRAYARCCELDGEGDAAQAAAGRRQRRGVLGRNGKIRPL